MLMPRTFLERICNGVVPVHFQMIKSDTFQSQIVNACDQTTRGGCVTRIMILCDTSTWYMHRTRSNHV